MDGYAARMHDAAEPDPFADPIPTVVTEAEAAQEATPADVDPPEVLVEED